MLLSDVQLGGIAVPGNEVGFLGIALAVLSEDGEHFTGRDIHVDAVVGNDPRVPLGDIFQAETWMHAEAGRRVGRPCQKLVRSGPAAARRATPDLNT